MDVGVGRKTGQGVHGQLLVGVDLGATVLIVERDASLNGAGDALGRIGSADARGENQHVIADAHATVAATIAHERTGALRGSRRLCCLGFCIGIYVKRVFHRVGAHAVMRVHVIARFDIACGLADELAVFDYRFARLDVFASKLVKQGDVLVCHQMSTLSPWQSVCHLIARMQRIDGHDHVIAIVDNNAIPHRLPFSR